MKINTVTVQGVTLGDGRAKICVPITAKNRRKLEEQARKAVKSSCHMVGWWADLL